jgi:hypothetical protein
VPLKVSFGHGQTTSTDVGQLAKKKEEEEEEGFRK